MNLAHRSVSVSVRTAIFAVATLGITGGAAMTACTSDDNDPGATTGTGGSGGSSTGAGGSNTGAGGSATGAGGAGGSLAGTACAGPLPVPASRPLITDFDSYDGATSPKTWNSPLGGDSASQALVGPFGYGDRTDGFPETFDMVAGHESTYSMHVADTLASAYGGGLGTWLSACLNATAFQGISFWVKGTTPTGKSTLTLSMNETLPTTRTKATDLPGTCPATEASKMCVHPTFVFDVPAAWTKIQVPWSSFAPGSAAGTPVMPNGRNIIQVQFGIDLVWAPDTTGVYVPTPAPYDVSIDTLAFY